MFKWLISKAMRTELDELYSKLARLRTDHDLLRERVISGEQRKYRVARRKADEQILEEGNPLNSPEMQAFLAGMLPQERLMLETQLKEKYKSDED